MKKLYVIGDPVDHSLSQVMHNAALKALGLDNEFTYDQMNVRKEELKGFIGKVRTGEIIGASVTMPYKEIIIPLLDELTTDADLIGAVNTIYIKDSRVIGHNTDGIGCIKTLEDAGVSISEKKIIILGAGGAAKAIAYTLALRGVKKLAIINRTKKKAEALAKSIEEKTNTIVYTGNFDLLETVLKDADIIINATSVGMRKISENQTLVTEDLIHSEMLVMDVVYNPKVTQLLKEARKAGAKTVDGSSMLVYQGTEQFKIFTGRKAPIKIMRKALLEVLDENSSKKN